MQPSATLQAALDELNLPIGTVIRRNGQGKVIATVEPICERLEKLGPFATTTAKLNIEFVGQSGFYSVDFESDERFRVTLDAEAKAAASVATLTNQQKQNLEEPVSLGDPEFTFLTFGGFAYFECGVGRSKLLCTNALVGGETGLTFEGPFSWKCAYTKSLYRQGRFEPITISYLSERGLQLYCFINPNEEVMPSNEVLKPWVPCPNGGFVYLYNSDGTPHPFDRYFSVASYAKPKPTEVRITPFSVVGKRALSENTIAHEFCCAVCLERNIQLMLLPCKHLCMCAECGNLLKQSEHFTCPLCRVTVTDVWDVFISGSN